MRFTSFLLMTLIYFSLTACALLPGMSNIHSTAMQEPKMIPITADYLMHASDADEKYAYKVQASDSLHISVWNHPELNLPNAGTAYLVDHDGAIYFPLIGNITVANKTLAEIRILISNKLSFYIRKPDVYVTVSDYRSQKIYVLGEVIKPGFLNLNDAPLSITQAIELSGSLDASASDPKHIYVIRGSLVNPEIYWLNASSPSAFLLGEKFILKNNDLLIISTAPVTRWSRFINQVLPSIQGIWYTKTITGK